MSEELRCIGCGSILQDQDPKKSGYLPTSALKKALTSDDNDCLLYTSPSPRDTR